MGGIVVFVVFGGQLGEIFGGFVEHDLVLGVDAVLEGVDAGCGLAAERGPVDGTPPRNPKNNHFQDRKESRYHIEVGKWIVKSTATTSKGLADLLEFPAMEPLLIVPVTGYFGHAQPDLWEWLAVKLASKATAA
jgi:hypothetical protein